MTGLLLLAALTQAAPIITADLDGDGLDDGLEQRLLERFRPTFVLSQGECDEAPARFEPGAAHPIAIARDGTIHGQATPRSGPPSLGVAFKPSFGGSAIAALRAATAESRETDALVELHYFHLWAEDCGRAGHALDAEHVSALVAVADDEGEWHALYWYAGAHEDTVCDASSGARAETLRASSVGPFVYISRGKHASYFDPSHCPWGCGGDACAFAGPSPAGQLINLGERGRPLNGATWVMSRRWPLASKLGSDFTPDTRARLDRARPGGVVGLMRHLQTTQAPLLAADTTVDALAATMDATGEALEATGGALGATAAAVGSAMKKTASGVARFLRLK